MTNRAHALIVLILFALCGCGRNPPEHFSVDEQFSEAEATVIRDAVASWCDAAGWCPTEVSYAERGRIILVDDISERYGDEPKCPSAQPCVTAGRNDGDNIVIARNRIAAEDMQVLWVAVAHELGHFCTDHISSGLMGAVHRVDEPAEIDAGAVEAWHAGCH